MMPEFLTFAETQERLREIGLQAKTRGKIYGLGKAGKLKLVKFGSSVFVTGQSLQALLNEFEASKSE